MERTTLGPVEQFRDDSGAWHVGQRLIDSGGWNLRGWGNLPLVAFRLYDTGDIVLVDESRLEPNVPNPPRFSESQAWREMSKAVEELADVGLTEIDLVDPGDS